MSDIKYTSSGKKVVVVGKINSTEFIVQEIYVTKNGDEIPSGENFTAKVLLDEPAETWYSKKEAEQKRTIDIQKSQIESYEKQIRASKEMAKARAELTKQSDLLLKNIQGFDFDNFCDVIAGNILYVVDSYGDISHFDKKMYQWESSYWNNTFEGIKCLTLFSKEAGNLEFRLNDYRDGSGSSRTMKFFKDKESVVEYYIPFLREQVADGKNDATNYIKTCKEFGITVPDDILKLHLEKKSKQIEKNIENSIINHEKQVQSYKEQLEKLIKGE